ncbi:MAG: hypothetical protein FWG53_10720 [Clostridiales bacterium]|nr:hypothetical protein [Clostridiales bacterium]
MNTQSVQIFHLLMDYADGLIRELPFSGVELVEFGFCPDWLGINPRWEQVDWDKEPFFLKGDWNLPEVFRFPAMSAT